jgi:serine/threonine protein kinase/predicted Zn-dependent protease
MSVDNAALPFGATLKNGKYRLEGVLGQGGFGITYRAVEVQTGTVLAIKELFPEDMAQRHQDGSVVVSSADKSAFEELIEHIWREKSILSQIKNSATTFAVESWGERNTVYLAMEYLEGETLEQHIARGELLTSDQANLILLTLLPLLQEVHALGFLHRDIKPANIILSSHGPELIDFGSGTPFMLGQRIKVTSRFLTPAYAPLEQYGQEVMIGPATDLYALAATLYEALTGTRVPSALDRANGVRLIPLAAMKHDLDARLIQVLEAALEMRLDARPQSALLMIRHLQVGQVVAGPTLPSQVATVSAPAKVRASFLPTGVTQWLLVGMLLIVIVFSSQEISRKLSIIQERREIEARVETIQRSRRLEATPNSSPSKNPFYSGAACVKHGAAGYSGEGDVYLLSFDDVSFERLARLYKKLSVRLGIRIQITGCMNAPFDSARQQFIAEDLTDRVKMIRIVPHALVMGITSNDLYIKQLGWAWAFGMYEPETGYSVISSARMDPHNFGAPKDEALLETRLRKMIVRYLGLLYFKKPPSNDPKSVLFGTLSGVADLDAREERY